MKKIIIVVLAMVMIFAACTKIDIKKPPIVTPVVSHVPQGGSVEIKGYTDFFGELDKENIEVVKNDDGSVTYKVPKDTYKDIMEDLKKDYSTKSYEWKSDAAGGGVEVYQDYSFLEALAILADDASDLGYYNITVTHNDDGSINYKIPKATHEEIIANIKAKLDKLVEDLKETSISGIEHDDSYKKIIILVEDDDYRKVLDGLKIYSLGFTSMYYQSLDGVPREDIKVIMYLKNQKTGEIIDTIEYSDKLKEFAENCKELADGVVKFAKDTAELFSSSDDD